MYLIINGKKHTVSKRECNKDTIKYYSVSPAVEDISGIVQMYLERGEGYDFLLSEDNLDDFKYKTMTGTLLRVSNKPAAAPKAPVVNTTTQDINQLRADVDYLATMMEVEL